MNQHQLQRYYAYSMRSLFNTALHVAAEGQFEMAEFLVGKGADVMAQNDEPETPLVLAFSRGRAQGYKFSLFLIEAMGKAGGDLNIHDKSGQTALTTSDTRDNSEIPPIVSALLENGADVSSEIPTENRLWSRQSVVHKKWSLTS